MYKIRPDTLFVGKHLIYLPSCDSTNLYAAQLMSKEKVPEGSIIITQNQTSGKGQRGNRWESSPGANLTFSVVLYPEFLYPGEQFYLNIVFSLALLDTLKSISLEESKVKWPNDIYYDDLKLGGILIENALKNRVIASSIVGIGLNVNQDFFNVRKAASLRMVTGRNYELNSILNNLLEKIEARLLQLKRGEQNKIKQEYRGSLYWLYERRTFKSDRTFEGKIMDVEESGKLVVDVNGSTRRFNTKEVVFVE